MTSPQVKYRRDYLPPDFDVLEIFLDFDLYPEKTRVINTMRLCRRGNANPDLVLDGENLQLISIQKENKTLSSEEYFLEAGRLRLPNCPSEFTLCIETEINPQANTALSGLYLSSEVFCTQCEAEGFRRITYFLDRPDVLTKYTTRITADQSLYPILLSNGNLIKQETLAQGRHRLTWEDPFKKPCYLFALVAGNLEVLEDEFITQSGRKVSLKIYVKEHINQCAHAMESLKQAMRWDEVRFGREYDLDIFMIVAVDDFNMGAMENKGLNIFNTKYILADEFSATDQDFMNVLTVVGHEYFHNWTGNRITCRDWFQLSLKEGLTVFRDQEFTADFYSRSIKRIEEVKIIKSAQFAEDASPMAHPIRPESYIEMNNFYTVTVYNKGAEVIRMMHTLLGEAGFRQGMDLYFSLHDGQAVTCEDFIVAMEEANQTDLCQFRRWYDQAGTPEVSGQANFDETQGIYTLTFTQTCPDSPHQKNKKPFVIPIALGLLDSEGKTVLTKTLVLKEPTETFSFPGFKQKPLASLLRDFSAPIKLSFPYTDAELRFLLRHDDNEFNRFEALQILFKKRIFEGAWQIEDLEAIRALLHSDCDPALIAEALTPPSEKALEESMSPIDVDVLFHARNQLIQSLSQALNADWEKIYEQMQTSEDKTPQNIAKRRLKNLTLLYWVHTESGKKKAYEQLRESESMTDSSAAFSALLQIDDAELQERASNLFFARYHHLPLTLNKWFQLQTMGRHPRILDTVRSLIQHPDFSFENPNRVHAVFLGFSSNPYFFHSQDGAGYRIMEEAILKLNAINPQGAARLAKTLMNFRRYTPDRQALMKACLERLNSEKLCPDVYEIVSKALMSF